MSKQTIQFNDFLAIAGVQHEGFINQLHDYLLKNGCITKMREAANGYVVSYFHKPTAKTVATYVFRKKMPMLRVYPDNMDSYLNSISDWPEEMKDAIKMGGNCSRLINPTSCNSRCLKGFDFILDGERQQKCRCHNSFTFFLNDETKPYLTEVMELEMKERTMRAI
ncbi:MAG: hypothetical protein FWC79_07330 [Oscillospiraceae bacterium]|nr:hypothetical protein [Oscillospiraceae bacterium]